MSEPKDPEGRPIRPRSTNEPSGAEFTDRWGPPDDEISLFDIWDALVRRRWVILGVFVAVSLLAAGYAVTRPDVYRYQVSLQIGQMVVESSEGAQREPLASTAATVAHLEASLVPAALREVLGVTEEQLATGRVSVPTVDIDSPSDSNLVRLSIESPQSKGERNREILVTAAGLVVQDHAGILRTEEIRLTRQRERLGQRGEQLSREIKDLQERIQRLTNSNGSEGGALTLRIDGLQQRVAQLQDRLLENRNERARVTDALAVLEDYSDLFSESISGATISKQREASQRIAAVANGLRPTRIISAPGRSFNSVGTSGSLILALGMVLGAMLGVFAAFLAEFISAARRRHEA